MRSFLPSFLPSVLDDDLRALRYATGLTGNKPRDVVDATPDYLADPIAAVHMAYLVPSAQIVALIRDPVARAHAAWDQNRRSNQEGRSFGDAVSSELPVARRCAQLAGDIASLFQHIGGGHRNATSAHGLIEYTERCALFFDGRP